jgi:hypothetical protein
MEPAWNGFEAIMDCHKGLGWPQVQKRLKNNPGKSWSLGDKEKTCREPDLIDHDRKSDECIICDHSQECPKDRLSPCHDRNALESRKEATPRTSAMDIVEEFGI